MTARSRGRSAFAKCMMKTGNLGRTLPVMSRVMSQPLRLLDDHCGMAHPSSPCGMGASSHQNWQFWLRKNETCLSSKTNSFLFHSTACWFLFQPRTYWSPFCTSAHLHTCTFNPAVTRVYHSYCVSMPTSVYLRRRNISHSLTHHLSKPEDKDDKDDVDLEDRLQAMQPFRMRRGGGGEGVKWHQNPWKLKRLRFTRHVMNLVKKGKVSTSFYV